MIEKLQNTKKDKFLNDFVVRVQGYLNKCPLNFKLESSDISLELLLNKAHLLPILLFDKQTFINEYLEKINAEHNSLLYAILVFEEDEDSCIGVTVRMEENISNNYDFRSVYSKLLLDLAEEVLKQSDFYIENNSILLDPIFNNFNKAIGSVFKIESKRISGTTDEDFIDNVILEIDNYDEDNDEDQVIYSQEDNSSLSAKVNKLKELVELKENLESVNKKCLSSNYSILIKPEIFDKIDLDILSLTEEINNI